MFRFRLHFYLPESNAIEYELNSKSSPVFNLHLDKDINLRPEVSEKKDNDIYYSRNFSFWGSGFQTELEAKEYGNRIKNALLVVGLICKIGIDTGNNEKTVWLHNDIVVRSKVKMGPDVHGLMILDETPVSIISCDFESPCIVVTPREYFTEKLVSVYNKKIEFTSKQILAIELYNMTYFETAVKAKFLTLITAIEVLSSNKKWSEEARVWKSKLIKMTQINPDLDSSSKEALINGLENLSQEKKLKGCLKTVKKYLGENMEKEFNQLYKIRGQLVHNGEVKKGVTINTEYSKLEKLVSSLLLKIIQVGDL